MHTVIKQALISEKSMRLAGQGVYTFIVDKDARKPEIIKAIENQFDVNVVSIKTANFKEEKKSQRSRRGYYNIPGFKKALVLLKKGQKISLFETEGKGELKEPEVKEKKSLLRGTKVKIEKAEKREKVEKKKESKKKGGE